MPRRELHDLAMCSTGGCGEPAAGDTAAICTRRAVGGEVRRTGPGGSGPSTGAGRAAGGGGSATGPRGMPGWLLLEDVLDLVAGLLEVALGLVALAFGFHLLVAGRLAQVLLDVALDLGGLVGRLVLSRHGVRPSRLRHLTTVHTEERQT